MYVLFDDGRTLDRRLRYEDTEPTGSYLGRYDPNTEAFQFFSPVDTIWGDYRKRDEEEEAFAYGDIMKPPYTKNKRLSLTQEQQERAKEKITKFNEKYYLKYSNGEVVDITKFPEAQLRKSKGIAFTIFRKDEFVDEFLEGRRINRNLLTSYFLEVKLVVDGKKYSFPIIDSKGSEIKIETISQIKLIKDNQYKNYPLEDKTLPNDDKQKRTIIYQLGPTLVLNSKTVLNNRNYTDKWAAPPADWDKMVAENPRNWDFIDYLKERLGGEFSNIVAQSQLAFEPKKYWGRGLENGENRMVVRLGREGNQYVLFLHGSKEGDCPIRIPTN